MEISRQRTTPLGPWIPDTEDMESPALNVQQARPKVLVVMGTRPEAIKLAPVIRTLKQHSSVSTVLVATAQHRHMLDQVLFFFGVASDYDLDLMRPSQSLTDVAVRSLSQVGRCLNRERPRLVLVQGDTTTTMTSALAAFYRQIPVAHLEAGLRTHDLGNPYPEELNRRIVGISAALHFAPTEAAASNLVDEGVDRARILVTGNTVIDALYQVRNVVLQDPGRYSAGLGGLDGDIVLVTAHRRENFGEPLARICRGLIELCARHESARVVYPVHPNPDVKDAVYALLYGHPRINLIAPVDYGTLVWLLDRCRLVITDSGGVQEEAPALGKPYLVVREKTERPEGVRAGAGLVVGTDPGRIAREAVHLLEDSKLYRKMASAGSPYGDGNAARRVTGGICWFLGLRPERPQEFVPGQMT